MAKNKFDNAEDVLREIERLQKLAAEMREASYRNTGEQIYKLHNRNKLTLDAVKAIISKEFGIEIPAENNQPVNNSQPIVQDETK